MISLSVNRVYFVIPTCKIKAIGGFADPFINIRQIANIHFFIFHLLVTLSVNNLTHSTKRLNRLVVLTTKKAPHTTQKQVFADLRILNHVINKRYLYLIILNY